MNFTNGFRQKCSDLGFDLDAFMAIQPSTTADNRVTTFVYILGCEHYVKVGIATNVEKRVAGLQAGNPFPIKVLRTVEYPSRLQALLVERTVHQVLAPHRHFSEWFTCEPKQAREAVNYVVAAMRKLAVIHARLEDERNRKWEEIYATDPKYAAEAAETRKRLEMYRERDRVVREAGNAFDAATGFKPYGR